MTRGDDTPLPILLVDDDPDCRLLMRDALEGPTMTARVAIHEATDAAAGLRFVRRQGEFADAPRPGLIFLDVEMPGRLDGIDLLRAIRADPAWADVPVVMMTGVCDDARLRAAAAAGANSYTIKPADAGRFLRTVADAAHYWLRVHQYPTRHLPAVACRR